MPGSQWQVGRTSDFRGGETQTELPEMVGRNQLIRMENVMIFPTGWVTAAHQADTVMVINAILGMAIVPYTNGTYNVFSAPGNDIVYGQFLDTSARAPVNMLLGAQTTCAGARIVGIHKAVAFLGKWYCANPSGDDTEDGVINLTDLTLVNIPGSTATAGRLLRAHLNRLWLINSDGTLHISNNGDAETWNALNVLLLANSEMVTNFFPVQGGAIVYGPNSIYAMFGSDYTDITFVPLMLGKQLTQGAVEVEGTVYILSTEGIYAVNLNGAQLIPHNQTVFFTSHFGIFSDPEKVVSAIYLQSFRAIMFSWATVYGLSQSLVFYLSGAYSKINKLLPTDFPYIIALNDQNTDYLVGTSIGSFAKSEYPSSNMLEPQKAILQTRHEDCDTPRDKVWSCLVILTGEVVYGVTVEAFVNHADKAITVADVVSLSKGANYIWLDDVPNGETLSLRITIDNTVLMYIVTDEDPTIIITDEDGNELASGVNPGNWTFKEIRLRFRPTGPDL
jgi:hypothetical protein